MRCFLFLFGASCMGYYRDDFSSEEKLLRRILVDSTPPSPPLASATLSNPVALLLVDAKLYASEFRRDRVLVSSTSKKHEWRVFADRGPHCARMRGVVDCAILDGAWGLARFQGLIFVSSFGSDQILGFDDTGRFVKVLGGPPHLDSPEGIVVFEGAALLAASFLDSRLVALDVDSGKVSTIAAGMPIEADLETGAFRPRSEEEVRRAAREEADLWRNPVDEFSFQTLLSGPEHVALVTDRHNNNSVRSIFVSSLHNDTLVEYDPATMTPRAVYRDLDGPLGIAVVQDPSSKLRSALGFHGGSTMRMPDEEISSSISEEAHQPVLLVASYRQDRILAIDLGATDLDDGSGVRSVPLVQDSRLQGPSDLVFDPPSSLYVACYDSGAVLYFDLLLPSSLLAEDDARRSNISSRSM